MVFKAKAGVNVERTVADTQFKIATNSKIFCILSDSIYTHKIDAVIRELCCNAFDAHVEAKQSRSFQVTLPDDFTPEFRVRDFGAGLSDEDMQMYTTYGESTKSGSNAYIGAFGIGAKSPFAYTNTFNVTSYYGGIARSYSMFVEQGAPRMTKLGEISSDEPSGLDVFFSVESKDIEEFQEKALSICALMADKLEVLNARDEWRVNFYLETSKYHWEQAPYIGDGYMINNLEVDINCKQDILNIIQGNVAYQMHLYDIIEMLKYSLGTEYNKLYNRVGRNFYIVGTIKVPNGTFVPHPSRERLTFDELTKVSLKNIFKKIVNYHINDAVDRILNGVESYYDLHIRLKGCSKIVSKNPRITDFNCPNMIDISPVDPIRNFDDWLKNRFACISIYGEKGERYKFKTFSNMSMYGEQINRIYYSSKYPLSEDYRYRVIHDKQQAEATNAIILTGNISRMFTDADKAKFINIQLLPELTSDELASLKKNYNPRLEKEKKITKDKVSYIVNSSNDSIKISQITTAEVMKFNSKYPVFWIASNRKYEITFANNIYKLSTLKDLRSFGVSIDFLFTYLRKINNIAKEKSVLFGVVVLPDNHELRELLPSLCEKLPDIIRQITYEFMKKNYYVLNCRNGYDDDLFKTLINDHRDLFMRLIAGCEEESFFTPWTTSGEPEFLKSIEKYRLPFSLLPDGDVLSKDYYSDRNIFTTSLTNIFDAIAEKGYPILRKFRWGCDNKEEINDLIMYLETKNKLIVQKEIDRN
jgi:hypothetical protein